MIKVSAPTWIAREVEAATAAAVPDYEFASVVENLADRGVIQIVSEREEPASWSKNRVETHATIRLAARSCGKSAGWHRAGRCGDPLCAERIAAQGPILVYEESGKPVSVGDIVTLPDGSVAKVQFFRPPQHPGSSGKVSVCFQRKDGTFDEDYSCREYFVDIIGARWIARDDRATMPESVEDIPVVVDPVAERDRLLDEMNRLPPGSKKRRQLIEKLRSFGARRARHLTPEAIDEIVAMAEQVRASLIGGDCTRLKCAEINKVLAHKLSQAGFDAGWVRGDFETDRPMQAEPDRPGSFPHEHVWVEVWEPGSESDFLIVDAAADQFNSALNEPMPPVFAHRGVHPKYQGVMGDVFDPEVETWARKPLQKVERTMQAAWRKRRVVSAQGIYPHGPECFCDECLAVDESLGMLAPRRCPTCGSRECPGDGHEIECRKPGSMTIRDVPVETRDSLLDKFNRGEIDEEELRRRMKRISILGLWRLRRAALPPDQSPDDVVIRYERAMIDPRQLEGYEIGQREEEIQSMIRAIKLGGFDYWDEPGTVPPPVAARVGASLLILDGHHRTIAAQTMGLREIPVLLVDEEDYEELRAAGWENLTIADEVYSIELRKKSGPGERQSLLSSWSLRRAQGPDWTAESARAFLASIEGSLSAAGFSSSIIGSVATSGESDKDLDILLKPLAPMTMEQAIDVIEKRIAPPISHMTYPPIEYGGREKGMWMITITLKPENGHRVIEFFLSESDFPIEGSGKKRLRRAVHGPFPAEEFFSREEIDKIRESNQRLWDDAVEAQALSAMAYLKRQWPGGSWTEDQALDAVAHVYDADDLREVRETPVMSAVLDQVLAWIGHGPKIAGGARQGPILRGSSEVERLPVKETVAGSIPVPADLRGRWNSRRAKKERDPDYERETREISENKKKPGARKPHDFSAAKWTHPNGHPRCLVCGNEEPIGGRCNVEPSAKDLADFEAELDAEFPGRGERASVSDCWSRRRAAGRLSRILRQEIGYNPKLKAAFHAEAEIALRAVADALGLVEGADYDLRHNQGGPAVSGEVTLHADNFYIWVEQSAIGGLPPVTYRTVNGRSDYTGGPNRTMSAEDLENTELAARKIRALIAEGEQKGWYTTPMAEAVFVIDSHPPIDVLDDGNIVRRDMPGFRPSGQWRFLGLSNDNQSQFVSFEDLKDIPDLSHFVGWHIVDFDHGSQGMWGSPIKSISRRGQTRPGTKKVEDVKALTPEETQAKIDDLLEQLQAETDPEKKKQIEQQIRSLTASIKDRWSRRRAEEVAA